MKNGSGKPSKRSLRAEDKITTINDGRLGFKQRKRRLKNKQKNTLKAE